MTDRRQDQVSFVFTPLNRTPATMRNYVRESIYPITCLETIKFIILGLTGRELLKFIWGEVIDVYYRFAKGFQDFYSLVKFFTVKNGLELGPQLRRECAKKTNKYEKPYKGPSAITKLLTNESVTIRKSAVQERINITWIKLYHA